MLKIIRFQFSKGNQHNFSRNFYNSQSARNFNNSTEKHHSTQTKISTNYSVEEIRISVPSYKEPLAGKLWRSQHAKSNQSNPHSSTPIICLHGVQDNCGSFDPLIPLFIKDNMTVFAMDLPGHGYSYHTVGNSYNFILDGFLSIKRTMRHFGWEKVTLVGHSMGSIISFLFSGSFPGEVHKYIGMDVVAPFLVPEVGKYYNSFVNQRLQEESRLAAGSERPAYTYDQLYEKMVKGRGDSVTPEGYKTLLIRGAEKVNGSDRYRFTHDPKVSILSAKLNFAEHSGSLKREIAKGLKCPVCVIKGEEDYEPREDLLRLVEFMSQFDNRVEYHEVSGTHPFHLNGPQLVAPIISKFLDE